MATDYQSYLKLEQILTAQTPLSEGEHDEMLFIIIHQSYELWFKQILHEGKLLESLLTQRQIYKSLDTLKRILTILKSIVGQIDILETMTPLSFASFRSRLDNASGFQSRQFRQVEEFLGTRPSSQKSIYHHLLQVIHAEGFSLPLEVLTPNLSQVYAGHPKVEDVIYEIYKSHPLLTSLCERFVDLDEGIQEWRYRHVKMVERTIGTKMGTGGSSGAEYLKKTLFTPCFVDLWNVRKRF